MKRIMIVAALANNSVAQTPAQKSAVFVPGGKAIKGYDPVTFLTNGKIGPLIYGLLKNKDLQNKPLCVIPQASWHNLQKKTRLLQPFLRISVL